MAGTLFVCFEGVEGSGKTTQARILHDRLEEANVGVTLVREPGTTPLGKHLREYLKSGQPLSPEAEVLLFEAARAELVRTTIKPSIDANISIIADRYEASSVAYQGFGRELDIDIINLFNNFATDGYHPDVTFLLDLPTDEEMKRIGLQLPFAFELSDGQAPNRMDSEGQRRFEDLPKRFHQKVRAGYLSIAKKDPDRWVVLDATRGIEDIANEVWSIAAKRLGLPTSFSGGTRSVDGAAL